MDILFIRGFNTDINTSPFNTYANFENFFTLSKNEHVRFSYFNYSPDNDIDLVYRNLQTVIKNGKYNILQKI